MADESQGRIELPIEIVPSDAREINQLLERIERAESKLFKIQTVSEDYIPETGEAPTDLVVNPQSGQTPRKRRSRVDTSELAEGRSPLGNNQELEEEGETSLGTIGTAGAFLLSRREEAMPRGKEKPINTGSSGAPIQRTPEFKKLLERQEKTEHLLDKLSLQNATGGLSTLSSFLRSPVGFLAGLFETATPVIAPILISKGLMDLILKELLKDGGVFDRRFKIKIEGQVVKTLSRGTLAQIRAGFQEVRVSTSQGLRVNRGSIGTNLNVFKPGGTTVYDSNLENYSKGQYQ